MRHLIAAALIALAAPAAAQEVPIVQAGAEGRFERQIDAKSRSDGFTSAEVAAFRGTIAPIIEQLAAMPSVSAPPAPVCHRLKSWIELINPHGVMGAEIGVMTPISFQNGRCHRMTGGGIVLKFNMPGAGLDPSHATVRREARDSDWYVLAFKPARNPQLIEYQMNGDDYAVITHGRAPLFRPVSMERYLQHRLQQSLQDAGARAARDAANAFTETDLQTWLRDEKPRLAAEYEQQRRAIAAYAQPGQIEQMRASSVKLLADMETAMRQKVVNSAAAPTTRSAASDRDFAALTAAQRAQPACMGAGLEPTPNAACPPDRTLVEINPAYFDRSRPTDIQLLILTTPAHRYHGEDDAKLTSRTAMWNALDRAALAARVR